MKKTALLFNVFLIAGLVFGVSAKAVFAGPHLSLSPSSGNYNVGQEFDVIVNLDPGGEEISGADGKGSYDSTRLELVSVTESSSLAFPDDPNSLEGVRGCDINEGEIGRFSFTCMSSNHLDPGSSGGQLVVFKFKAKAIGTATVKFDCTQGLTTDSGITRNDPVGDVIVCSENVNGAYVIEAGSDTSPTNTPALDSSDGTTETEEGDGELLQTGGVGATVGLILFGFVSVASAVFLKFL